MEQWLWRQVDRNGRTRIDSVSVVTRHFNLIEILADQAKNTILKEQFHYQIRIEQGLLKKITILYRDQTGNEMQLDGE